MSEKKDDDYKVESSASNRDLEPHKKPLVFLCDCGSAISEKLRDLRHNCHEGSLGANIKVGNKYQEQKYLKLNCDYPSNLNEFDVVLLDFTNKRIKEYDPLEHEHGAVSGGTVNCLLSTYPEQVFDPRPLSINIMSAELNELSEKASIIIAFCGSEAVSEYRFLEITERGSEIKNIEKFSDFDFYAKFPRRISRHGRKVRIPENETKLSPLLTKHLNNILFETVFFHPVTWRDGGSKKIENFYPLLINEREEIVSYAHFVGQCTVLVFPNIEDKSSFVSELFKAYLPQIAPDIFPFHGEFKWLASGDYLLPGEELLHLNRSRIDEKYQHDITDNDRKLGSLKDKYKFLNDLLVESGESLVSAVETYLNWLGFDSVVNLDDTNPELLEEDIQIDCGDKFLVIEIKGLGGTSTDKDCSQVSKIRYRRAEQRKKFDVYGLYIVNHQRYMPPKSRANPPFTNIQIKDAELDKRGLLTTYDLYSAYFDIENDVLTKAEVRDLLFKTGLISIEPEGFHKIGDVTTVFRGGQIIILDLSSVTLSIGDLLLIKKQGTMFNTTIESLQVDGKDVDVFSDGEVGIGVSEVVKKNSEVFAKIT